jgi:leader peptidase (prepilin peptidase) / N-methyltransferase
MLVSPLFDAAAAGVFGLLIGSFLNVVIYRLPLTMYREWLAESVGNLLPAESGPTLWSLALGAGSATPPQLERAATDAAAQIDAMPPFGLSTPRSRCASCGQAIRWYQNIPVMSYLFLRGRCAVCRAPISVRYPLIELVTGGLFALCAWRWGLTPTAALWAAFSALLLCQFVIDLDTQLLPDSLNYLLLWLGLLGAAMGWTGVPLGSAVWGAALGYLSLWLVFHAYRLVTSKEGMGHGDFKLLAALGAWLGAPYLVAIILLSSVVGSVLGGFLLLTGRLAHKDIPISFGPFLAGAGLLCVVIGPQSVKNLIPFAFPFGS